MNIILEGIVGSTAYGLNTPDSDIDLLGIYVAELDEILGFYSVKETITHTNPDYTYHEVGKYLKLAMNCNPTILELMYLDSWNICTPYGKLITENRHHFLSNHIFNSYGKYALSQARKLSKGLIKGRYEKHARHCFRLLLQGKQLLETGTMDVKLKNPDYIMNIGKLPSNELLELFEHTYNEFKGIKSILPDVPNYDVINKLLLNIRKLMD